MSDSTEVKAQLILAKCEQLLAELTTAQAEIIRLLHALQRIAEADAKEREERARQSGAPL